MDKSTEYQALRQEIVDTFNREMNLTTIGFTATAAIIGYGFTTKTPFVFLVPLVILALVVFELNTTIYAILTIAIYIRIYIETGDKNLKWETTLHALRKNLRKQKSKNPMQFSEVTYAISAIAMGITCIFISASYGSDWIDYLITGVIGIIWLAFCLSIFRRIKYADSGLYEDEMERRFKEIRRPRKS